MKLNNHIHNNPHVITQTKKKYKTNKPIYGGEAGVSRKRRRLQQPNEQVPNEPPEKKSNKPPVLLKNVIQNKDVGLISLLEDLLSDAERTNNENLIIYIKGKIIELLKSGETSITHDDFKSIMKIIQAQHASTTTHTFDPFTEKKFNEILDSPIGIYDLRSILDLDNNENNQNQDMMNVNNTNSTVINSNQNVQHTETNGNSRKHKRNFNENTEYHPDHDIFDHVFEFTDHVEPKRVESHIKQLVQTMSKYYDKRQNTKTNAARQTINELLESYHTQFEPATDVYKLLKTTWDNPNSSNRNVIDKIRLNTLKIHIADCAHDWTNYVVDFVFDRNNNKRLKRVLGSDYTALEEVLTEVKRSSNDVNQSKCQQKVQTYGQKNREQLNSLAGKTVLIPDKESSMKIIDNDLAIPSKESSIKNDDNVFAIPSKKSSIKNDKKKSEVPLNKAIKNTVEETKLNSYGIQYLNIESDNIGILKHTITNMKKYTLNAGKYMNAASLGIGTEYQQEMSNYKQYLPVIISSDEYERDKTQRIDQYKINNTTISIELNNISTSSINFVINNIFLGGLMNGKLRVDTEIKNPGNNMVITNHVFLKLSNRYKIKNLNRSEYQTTWLHIECGLTQQLTLNGLAKILGFGTVRGTSVNTQNIKYSIITSKVAGDISLTKFKKGDYTEHNIIEGMELDKIIECESNCGQKIAPEDTLNIMFLKTLTDSIQLYYMLIYKSIYGSKIAMIICDITCSDYALSLGLPVIQTRSPNIDLYIPDIYQTTLSKEDLREKLHILAYFSDEKFVEIMLVMQDYQYQRIHKLLTSTRDKSPDPIYHYASKFALFYLDKAKTDGIDTIKHIHTTIKQSNSIPPMESIMIMESTWSDTFKKLSGIDTVIDKYEEVQTSLRKFMKKIKSLMTRGTARGHNILPMYFGGDVKSEAYDTYDDVEYIHVDGIKQQFVNMDVDNKTNIKDLLDESIFFMAYALITMRSRDSIVELNVSICDYNKRSSKLSDEDNLNCMFLTQLRDKYKAMSCEITNIIENRNKNRRPKQKLQHYDGVRAYKWEYPYIEKYNKSHISQTTNCQIGGINKRHVKFNKLRRKKNRTIKLLKKYKSNKNTKKKKK